MPIDSLLLPIERWLDTKVHGTRGRLLNGYAIDTLRVRAIHQKQICLPGCTEQDAFASSYARKCAEGVTGGMITQTARRAARGSRRRRLTLHCSSDRACRRTPPPGSAKSACARPLPPAAALRCAERSHAVRDRQDSALGQARDLAIGARVAAQ